MVGTAGSEPAMGSKSRKADLSPDWSLQLDSMKLESLVIADQHAAVNTFPVIDKSLDVCLLAVSSTSSAPVNSHGVTGGVYKTRERIHRGMLIRDY